MNRLGKFRLPGWLLMLLLSMPAAYGQFQELGDGGPGPVKAQHLTAELVSLAPGVSPGGTATVGLVLTLEDHWHVYWINAGDSGNPPTIKWTLPAGVTAGPLQFPVPARLPLGPLMDFGYEGTAAFPVAISVAKDVKPGPIKLDAKVTWLVCSDVCLPGKAHLGITLNVAPGSTQGEPVGALGTAMKDLPKALPAGATVSAVGGATDFLLTFHGLPEGHDDPEFYPFDQDVMLNAGEQLPSKTADGFSLQVPRSPDLKTLPATLHGLIKTGDTEAYDFEATVTAGQVTPAAGAGPRASVMRVSSLTVWSAVGLAFLGGIILNLMPCVFPVLFLKGLALVQSSGSARKQLRSHGLVYTLGILVSFWAIVAALLILKARGSQAGWGFQLQSPVFIALLAAGLFFFALSLAGQFELGLSMTSVGGGLAQKEGYAGSFFTGVLATIVATPCTAPLMGAAIGFALAQSAGVTFAIFTALALGLATPYLLLTLQPAWTRWLPRPGAWMEVLKQLTAVPLFATVIWLAWVYGRLFTSDFGSGSDHMGWLLLGLLVIAIAGWVLGRWPAKTGATVAAVLLIGGGLAIPLSHSTAVRSEWAPYTPAALSAARASGKPVFVDFTAAWCLSCQVNERAVLKSAEVESELHGRNFTLLKADWTQYDENITKELAAVGRSGVPTYVIYPGKPGSAPDVLPELLTRTVVLQAIAKDSR